MRLKVIKPINDMGVWKKPGDYIAASGWRASKLLQSGAVVKLSERETASFAPPEKAVLPEPEPKAITVEPEPPRAVGGGWFELADGRKVRRSQLEEGE